MKVMMKIEMRKWLNSYHIIISSSFTKKQKEEIEENRKLNDYKLLCVCKNVDAPLNEKYLK